MNTKQASSNVFNPPLLKLTCGPWSQQVALVPPAWASVMDTNAGPGPAAGGQTGTLLPFPPDLLAAVKEAPTAIQRLVLRHRISNRLPAEAHFFKERVRHDRSRRFLAVSCSQPPGAIFALTPVHLYATGIRAPFQLPLPGGKHTSSLA